MKLLRIIDTETTGLDPAVHRICEVAAIDIRFDDASSPIVFEKGEMFSTLVDPEMAIPPESSGVHDLTDEMVAGKPKFPELLERLKSGPPDAYCAHNSRFDAAFFKPNGIPWLDTYRLALWLWPEAPSHKLNALRYWLKLRLNPPTTVIQRAHSASWDAYICAAILRRIAFAGVTFDKMVRVSNEPALLPRFTFGKWAMKPIADVLSDYLQFIIRKGGGAEGFEEDILHTAMHELQRRRDA